MPGSRATLGAIVALVLLLAGLVPALAHEGHDHDKPAPLALPVAPRVVAITPDFELVGVSSGKQRLTVFLHTFATNEPIRGARMTVAAGDDSAEAKAEGDGVFSLDAPWLDTNKPLDLVFTLTLADGAQDLLAGTMTRVATQAPAPAASASSFASSFSGFTARPDLLLAIAGGLVAGVLLTLYVAGGRAAADHMAPAARTHSPDGGVGPGEDDKAAARAIAPLHRTAGVLLVALLAALAWPPGSSHAAEASTAPLPTVPSTMATDLAQRMPDASLFVPKATQHLLSIRTTLTAKGAAAVSMELTGTTIAGPENFGRVQPGRPGRIEAAPGGLPYVGKSVKKGEALAYVQTYIEAADRANIESLIAETEARIEKNRTILSRYDRTPGSVPQVKVDEVRGELEALTRKRAELVPSVARREPVLAPISGVVSLANAAIGQIVDARDILFEIVDPSQLWVEAISFGKHDFSDLDQAFAVTQSGEQIPLTFMGQGLALRQQATVLTFKMKAAAKGLAIGAPVKVVLQSTRKVSGFVLPSSAIVRGPTGLPVVWIKTDAERFEPQVVKAAPLDGTSVVVTSGLTAEKRVVTDGVTLLNQVR